MTMLPRALTATLTLLTGIVLLASSHAQATVIQILHTNDLHAAMNTSGEPKEGEEEFGGWAQIKTVLDQYTEKAKAQGIETLRMDAGDYLEGSLLYFPKRGLNIQRTYQQMGYEVSALGNHDWLMGATSLDTLLGMLPFGHPVVSANIKINPRLKNLHAGIKPYTIIEKAGVKLGVFGLSTTEAFYKWIPKIRSKKSDFKFKDYLDEEGPQNEAGVTPVTVGLANKVVEELKPQVDAVIALTHIGFDEDIALVGQSRGIDLVVGGHSHTFLETLNVEKDRDGREIPIVQAGYNGHMIGRVLIEVNPGQQPRVLTCELIPVPHDTVQDPVIQKSVAEANADLNALYGADYLNEVIGTSEVRLVPGKYGPTAYSKFAVDSIREAVGTDVSIDIGAFHSNTPQPGGIVTRQKLMDMYPRKFEVDHQQGLYVYRAKMPGLVLALGLKYAVKYGIFVAFSGADYTVEKLSDAEFKKAQKKEKESRREILTRYRAKQITVNGQKICLTCTYEVSAPESLIRGAYGISPLLRLIVRGGESTGKTLWNAFEEHLRKIQVIKALDGNEKFSPRRYANFYQAKFGNLIDPSETLKTQAMSRIDPIPSDGEPPTWLLDDFVKDVLIFQGKNIKIDEKTDADSVLIEREF